MLKKLVATLALLASAFFGSLGITAVVATDACAEAGDCVTTEVASNDGWVISNPEPDGGGEDPCFESVAMGSGLSGYLNHWKVPKPCPGHIEALQGDGPTTR